MKLYDSTNVLCCQGHQGELGARGAAGLQVTTHLQMFFLTENNDKLSTFSDLKCLTNKHTSLQGEPGPDGVVGFPGVRGPQV